MMVPFFRVLVAVVLGIANGHDKRCSIKQGFDCDGANTDSQWRAGTWTVEQCCNMCSSDDSCNVAVLIQKDPKAKGLTTCNMKTKCGSVTYRANEALPFSSFSNRTNYIQICLKNGNNCQGDSKHWVTALLKYGMVQKAKAAAGVKKAKAAGVASLLYEKNIVKKQQAADRKARKADQAKELKKIIAQQKENAEAMMKARVKAAKALQLKDEQHASPGKSILWQGMLVKEGLVRKHHKHPLAHHKADDDDLGLTAGAVNVFGDDDND
jgi:hypothetical protein